MPYYGIIPLRKPKSISTGKLILLMLSVPLGLVVLFILAYVLSNFILCPMMLGAKPLCGGALNVGMLLITFFALFIPAFIIFIFILVKRFSSPANLTNLPQYEKANEAMLQMIQDAQSPTKE